MHQAVKDMARVIKDLCNKSREDTGESKESAEITKQYMRRWLEKQEDSGKGGRITRKPRSFEERCQNLDRWEIGTKTLTCTRKAMSRQEVRDGPSFSQKQ